MGMIQSIPVTDSNWIQLKSRLEVDYGRTILLLRERCRDKLGFKVRYHNSWVNINNYWQLKELVYLDFYDSPKQLIFFMKYADFIDLSGKT